MGRELKPQLVDFTSAANVTLVVTKTLSRRKRPAHLAVPFEWRSLGTLRWPRVTEPRSAIVAAEYVVSETQVFAERQSCTRQQECRTWRQVLTVGHSLHYVFVYTT